MGPFIETDNIGGCVTFGGKIVSPYFVSLHTIQQVAEFRSLEHRREICCSCLFGNY